MPITLAAAWLRPMHRPRTEDPLSLMLTEQALAVPCQVRTMTIFKSLYQNAPLRRFGSAGVPYTQLPLFFWTPGCNVFSASSIFSRLLARVALTPAICNPKVRAIFVTDDLVLPRAAEQRIADAPFAASSRSRATSASVHCLDNGFMSIAAFERRRPNARPCQLRIAALLW